MHSSKAHNGDKPIPGCLGRMVNLFDMSTGVSRNKLLTDKPHRDGSSLSRSQSDVVTMLGSPYGDQIEDKVIVSELRRSSSNSKANGTPIKMLLDQEMSKEVETKKNPPNVVAKLMGLDAFPRQLPDSAAQRSNASNCSHCTNNHSSVPSGCWQQEDEFLDKQMQHEFHQCPQQNDYKDVYEVWQQPQKTSYGRNKSPQKGRYNEKQMDLVRQKFMEVKRLATDERHRQSKEFQDALEVLSSNKDMFLKFLQEPNSLFSQHLYDLQSLPLATETKRITVLRPTKMVSNDNFVGSGNKSDKQTKKSSQVCQAVWESHHVYPPIIADQKVDEYSAPPTRIVVLRPSTGKTLDGKTVVSSPISSARLQGENFYEEHEDDEVQESIEVEEEITQTKRDNSIGHRRDETLLSSVFSNGYTGDESSFHKSEIEYAAGILSDSEVMSPSPRHTWDYINRFGGPFSSSYSRMSCSPESSVCREAKKRLSERWAMMSLNGNPQEQRHARRSSSTLGEMLALSEVKKSTTSEDESSHKEQERRESVSCLTSESSKERLVDSPCLLRSKSLPVSSAVFSSPVNSAISDHGKIDVPKELNKTKSMKSSLKGKVSSLFFSKNKKSNKEKSEASQANYESQSSFSGQLNSQVRPGITSDDASQCSNDGGFEGCFSPALCGASGKDSPVVTNVEQKQGTSPWEVGLSLAKPVAPGSVVENQDQPSPISVLEPPFVEDENIIQEFSRFLKPDHLGRNLKSNLIDKSPPIGSIARTLSWDESCAETATPYGPYLVKSPSVSTSTEEEEQDWHAIVQTLLSAAGLDGELQCDSFFGKWHSLESPLDPSLRDKYANPNDKEPLHEAKRRKWRSSRKLVFDCVNAALVDITGYGASDSGSTKTISCSGAHDRYLEGNTFLLADRVWSRVKEWFLSEVRCVPEDGGDINNQEVERVVKKEVVGRGWPEQMRCEIDIVGKEIEGKLLQELVEEAVVDFDRE
ncbi:uncharacterized protein LOC126783276 [Argentina anserina]|uniref:uncharacterized protein LOC126783276 n=1 Tax=Argentina anserina TaxID=57926 RepID=UPI00217693C9|nr:uncharacterized protein LOC126783276 [Potentilla anserina]XP_050364674.1 uncharacterized protein LOC126783276 [Potentilla anserina]